MIDGENYFYWDQIKAFQNIPQAHVNYMIVHGHLSDSLGNGPN